VLVGDGSVAGDRGFETALVREVSEVLVARLGLLDAATLGRNHTVEVGVVKGPATTPEHLSCPVAT